MQTKNLALLLLFACAASQTAFGQFKIGDEVVVIREAEIKAGDKVIEKVHRGMTMRVNEVKDDWLWVDHPAAGWVNQKMVTTPANAIDVFTEQIKQNPNDAGAYEARALAWRVRNELDIAIGDLNDAIRLDSTKSSAYHNRGMCLSDKGEITKSITDYTEAIRLDPKGYITYTHRADSWTLKGEYAKAVSDSTEAIRLAPKYVYAYARRAAAFAATKNFEKAVADCDEARKISVKGTQGYNHVAWFLATTPLENARDGKKAIEFATKASELTDWKDAAVLDTLATAYAETGNFDEAIKWQTKAIDMTSDNDRLEYQTRLILFKSGKPFRQKVD